MTTPTNNNDDFSGNDIRIYKQKFKTLIQSKEKIGKKFDSIKRRLKTLQQIYNDLVVNNNNELALFGLDTFFFQNSLIQNDFQNIEKDFKLINNRVYCDFYKLHRIILKYIKNEIKCDMVFYDRIFHNFLEAKFPRYNDVEPMKNYDIKIVKSIFDNVCNVLNSLSSLIKKNNKELSELKKKQTTGLEIHNFVLTLQHQNTLIMEQTKLYKKYLSFFLDLHEKYFNRLHGKLAYMRTQMNVDIRFKTMDHLSLNNDFDDKEEYKDDDLDYILMMLPENINKKIMNKYFDHLLVETGDGDDANEIVSVENNN